MALASLGAAYSSALARAPFAFNCTTGFVIAAAGDAGCQLWFEGDKPFDSKRTLDMGLIRAFLLAPFLTKYFPFLNWLVPGKTTGRILARVGADQIIGSPLVICATFAASAAMQGRPETFPSRVEQQFWPTWLAGACYWPLVHTVNFRVVPVVHQTLVAHIASLYWNGVLAYRSNQALHGISSSSNGSIYAPVIAVDHSAAAERGRTAEAEVSAAGVARLVQLADGTHSSISDADVTKELV